MNHKNRFLATAAVALMAVFAVLGSRFSIPKPEEKTENVMEAEQKETIYFWYTDEALSGYINSAAVNFGEREQVHVIPVLQEEQQFLEKVNEASVGADKNLPDAFVITNDLLEQAYLAGLAVEPDSEYLTPEQFPTAAMDAVTYSGKRVAYPFYFDTCTLLYNRTYLTEWLEQQKQKKEESAAGENEAGEEFEGEITAAVISEGEAVDGEAIDGEVIDEEASEDADMEGQITQTGIPLTMEGLLYIADTFDVPEGVEGIMKWDVSDIFYNYWFVGKHLIVGGEAGDDPKKLDMKNAQTIECLKVYQSLNQFFSIEAGTVSAESSLQEFLEGKLVFTLANGASIKYLAEVEKEGKLSFEYGYASVPDVAKNLESRSLSVTGTVAVNGYSKHQTLANAFAKYLTEEYSTELFDKGGKLAAAESASGDGNLKIFHEAYQKSISLPKLMEINNLWLQLEAVFAKVWNGEEPTPLMEELNEEISAQLLER